MLLWEGIGQWLVFALSPVSVAMGGDWSVVGVCTFPCKCCYGRRLVSGWSLHFPLSVAMGGDWSVVGVCTFLFPVSVAMGGDWLLCSFW